MEEKNIYQLNINEVLRKYNISDLENGLTDKQVKESLLMYGLNKLESKKIPKWKLLLRQFNNMIIYILLFSALLTLIMGHISDALIIALVVIVNALIGYYQEASASDALERIQEMLSSEATVYRDGIRKDILSEEVVVGDVVFLEAGDNVPADLRIVEADNLRIQESALTGEPDSVEKTEESLETTDIPLAERVNLAFASTSVTSGSGIGVVTSIGEKTEIGKISTDVNNTETRKTPLMKEIDGLGKGITYVIMGVAIALFVFSLILETYSLSVLSLAVVTMIVGSIPEGLPATTSVVLAMGVSDMAKNKNTIVKTLPSVETLGSVDVVATDKTGTLTKNEMTVKDIIFYKKYLQVTGDGYKPKGEILHNDSPVVVDNQLELFLEAGFEANDTVLVKEEDRWTINGEPTDGSFLTLFYKQYSYPEKPDYEEIDMLPFDSDYRYMAKLVENSHKERIIFIKGSPDKLFPMAQSFDSSFDEKYWFQQVTELSEEGKRVVAVGFKKVSSDIEEVTHELLSQGIDLLGIAGIIDPPREEVIHALKEMNRAGVHVKMITGDHPLTAKAIGEKLCLAPKINVVTGAELDSMSHDEFKNAVLYNQVFARTTPKNKMDIVEALQESGKVTAMTGDGVNDAPALKKADIGVAMGMNGTDVAKDSADMILTDDNFGTMSVAIREGRKIYDNIKKSILFLLPTSFAEGLIIAFTILTQKEMPLQPTQLLWINMVSAITIQFAFIFEPAEKGIMLRKPRKNGNRLLNNHDIWQMAYVSVLMALISIISYEWLLAEGVSQAVASTMMINVVVLSKIFYLFNIRTSQPVISKSFFSNPKAFVIILIMIVLQLILTYVPFMQSLFYTSGMSIIPWGISIASGIVILIITEIDKLLRLKTNKQT
ncbi:HAD-IC family P-type ATPase [Enterococcus faecalis]|uniref:HAD-IC family P-type ATPase n=1 Tax=Enterococcus TaxID=1350 RepID=UPI000B3BF4FD|nr:HAD-IC family P-type ATPase [Enterococcus faecalis]ARV05096.1 magnesium-transporting ATPase [Enterococcus faecalis]MBG9437447.1 HAD-IC family P-type ATPase [Enterococcus faecalis]MBG9440209.1 HAD-IC family P-type ATPase [Enterococcus faecalis]MBG9443003.1 HAD-IC family P-type ATPase [Enterococcus faecalis]MDL4860457.1 HAD-IC family P-type ATPase [Enterococcus faecalis]